MYISDKEVMEAIKDYGEVTYGSVQSVLETDFPKLISDDNELLEMTEEYYDKALSAFSVCPRCEMIVETLIEKVSGFNRAEFKVNEANSIEVVEDYGFKADDGGLWYECPSCDEIIFEDFGEALTFLKMERK